MSSPKDKYPIDPEQYPSADASVVDAGELGVHAALLTELDRLAPSKVTVLLVGGTPTLQHASARVLHDRSARASQPFVAFDCSGLTPERTELSLFGGPAHLPAEDGAIQIANAGTLYVVAVNELPLLLHPRLLRFLDDDRSVRVVASTARDLTRLVERGSFRLDLAERLSLVELVLPEEP